jgi:hypothetical protein
VPLVVAKAAVVAAENAPSRSARVTDEPAGTVKVTVVPVKVSSVVPAVVPAPVVNPTVEVAAVPTTPFCVAVPTVPTEVVIAAACAGTTDKSPNPSEATATADTFFNEIVFTIFLSFSQIKDDLLPGW